MDPAERHISKALRTFIAVRVEPNQAAEEMLSEIRTSLCDETIVWNRTANFHVTLLFIGDTFPEQIVPVQQALDRIAKQSKPFDFTVSGLGVFRTIHRPRVLWMGVNNSIDLMNLKQVVDEELCAVLKPGSREMFKPHLTIGRMRRIDDQKNLSELIGKYEEFVFLRVKVEEILFYESITTPDGPVYQVLSAHPLK